MSEAFLSTAIFATSIVYSILYLGHWPALRDFVNILDKHNWDLFGIYAVGFLSLVLLFLPGLLYLLALAGKKLSPGSKPVKSIFLEYTGVILPLGLSIWIAFVIPMLFVNVTFIAQSFSDPFGWGWNFFGAANIPWRQFIPQYIPWIQAMLVLAGLHFSLMNVTPGNTGNHSCNGRMPGSFPIAAFLVAVAAGMIVFFTN